MIRYLVDSSALWRIQRDKRVREAWTEAISNGALGSCHPQRSEFRRSAPNRVEFDAMTDMFTSLYPDVPVPKTAWQWIDAAQYRMSQTGQHRGLSVVDLLVAASAAHHGLIVVHDDNDFPALARNAPELRERNVHSIA